VANRYYDRALQLDSEEDYYLLFKGKVLLEEADGLSSVFEAQLESQVDPEILSAPTFSEYDLPSSASDLEAQVVERDRAFESALAVLTRAVETAPRNTDHHANLGRAYQVWGDRTLDAELRRERLEQSREWFESAIALSPNNAQLREELGTTEYIAGDRDGAFARIEEAFEIDSEYGRPYKLRATIYREQSDWENAEADYRSYVESKDGRKDSFGWSALAYVLGQQDKLEDARDANEQVLEIAGEDLSTLRNLVIINRDLGDRYAACEYALRGLNVDDQDAGLQSIWSELDCANAGADR
jgi:tetratricopeptide (TPR) repeat protein